MERPKRGKNSFSLLLEVMGRNVERFQTESQGSSLTRKTSREWTESGQRRGVPTGISCERRISTVVGRASEWGKTVRCQPLS